MKGIITPAFILALTLSVNATYSTPAIAIKKTNLPAKVDYIGCLKDSYTRTLPFQVWPSGKLTVENCHSKCTASNHPYSGVENGGECFCGDSLDPKAHYYSGADETKSCNVACQGDSNYSCGGSWALNVYHDSSVILPPKIKKTGLPKNVEYLGCFKDSEVRILPILLYPHGLTLEICHSECSAAYYPYSSLESGNECWCGDKFNPSNQIYEDEKNCNKKCAGDSLTACGGSWAANIYHDSSVIARPWPQIKKTGLPENADYIGCSKDQASRILSKKLPDQETVTVNSCIAACSAVNHIYSGLQYGKECWCGDELINPMFYTEGESDGKCNFRCKGESSEVCGGLWKTSVYKQAPAKKCKLRRKETEY
jgi:hypothetical protein